MKVLKYSIIAKLIIKKHKRDVEIIFPVIKNIKAVKCNIFYKISTESYVFFHNV